MARPSITGARPPLLLSLALTGLLLAVAPAVTAAVRGKPSRPHEDLPSDKSRSRVQTINNRSSHYEITFQGTVDGAMTRSPIGYGPFRQRWQPNRSVTIENIGQTDVIDPRLVVNGKRNWYTLRDMVTEATRGHASPADRARAIWEFQRRSRFHATTWDGEDTDAVKALNIFGYTLCGNEAQIINDLWKAAGLKTRRGHPIGHCVSEAWYDGNYHLLDSDEHVICLKRDNRTIASCEEVVRDHDLIKRTHSYGILRPDGRKTDEFSASLYSYEGKREGDYGDHSRHAMKLRLRPGESLELRWDHVGKEYSAGIATKPGAKSRDGSGTLEQWGAGAHAKLRNGKLRYQPDFSKPFSRRGVTVLENAILDVPAACIHSKDASKPSRVVWDFASPYVLVGGHLSAEITLPDHATARWQWSADQKSWTTIHELSRPGTHDVDVRFDQHLSPRRRPDYQYWLQLVIEGSASLKRFVVESDIQTSALSLPELEVGGNRVSYTDSTDGPRTVRITHRWLERTAWHPPAAPLNPISPKDNQSVAGSRVFFQWSPATDPDGDRIVDYHIEVSEHADMHWPLSPNFEKLISNTPQKGKAAWRVPYVGLLNPETTYYWHVRAMDRQGVWGPWSRTFRFRVRAPGVPLNVRLILEKDGGLRLTWQANPQGETPARYQIHGSNEKGFSISDTDYFVERGRGFVRSMDEYEKKSSNAPDAGTVKVPANLVGRVKTTSMRVTGPNIVLPNTNKCFYRVVAVDAQGNESGASDYAEVPRPCMVNRPATAAIVGKPYRFEPKLIRSIGDLQCRRSRRSSYNAAYWDREQYTFAAIKLPAWLALDTRTGRLTGTPPDTGLFDVSFDVINDKRGKKRLAYQLRVRP